MEILEEQWAIANGTHDDFLEQRRRRMATEQRLARQSGEKPSPLEIERQLLLEDARAFAADNQWGLYRNARFRLGESFWKDRRASEALQLWLEVCYLDLNGPNNCGGLERFPELLTKYPPFNPATGILAPGLIRRCERAFRRLQLTGDDIAKIFLDTALAVDKELSLPVAPDTAWVTLAEQAGWIRGSNFRSD